MIFQNFMPKIKPKKYHFIYVKNYIEKLKKDFNHIINKEDLIINGITRNINFDLKLIDEYFSNILNDNYLQIMLELI